MADPVLIDIPVDTWVPVAIAKTAGNILPLLKGPYLQTIRETGGVAPTNTDLSEGKEIPFGGARIESSTALDVYVAVVGDEVGKVRVDL